MPSATVAIVLRRGVSEKVLFAANNTGTGFSQAFTIPVESGQHWGQATFQGICHTITAIVATLEVSLDGGVTFSAFNDLDLKNVPVQMFNLNGGSAIYRFNVKSMTANASTCDAWVLVG